MNMIVIVGGGSIGKRHLKNLLAIGEKNIIVVEVHTERATAIQKEFGVSTVVSVDEAFKVQPNIAFICSPTAYHLEQALLFARAGCDLFIEKPLSHTIKGLAELEKLVDKKNLVTMVGSNWKFYPLFRIMKDRIDARAIGDVLSLRCQFGQYLPDWHPYEDYRQGYSAKKSLGGGILLDCHEIDYATWFVGKQVQSVFCLTDKVSNLEIDVEDVAEILLQFDHGAIAEIHVDYVQRVYQRNFEFFGTEGTMTWDIHDKKVVIKKKDGIEEFPLPEPYDINAMYSEEIRHFLDCVRARKQTMTPVSHGAMVVKLISAAKESAKKQKVIRV